MRGKEKEGPPYFTLWWGVWKELLRTDLHINLSSVFPFFFFFFVKLSWPGPPPRAHWLPPRDTTQLPVPTDSTAPCPPAIVQGSAMDTHHQGLFIHCWLQSIFCFISVSLFQGELLRLFLNLYSAPCFSPPPKPRFLGQEYKIRFQLCTSQRSISFFWGLCFRRFQVYQLSCPCLDVSSSIICVPLCVKHNGACFQREFLYS